MNKKLKNHPYANCYVRVINDGEVLDFISYNTVVIRCRQLMPNSIIYFLECYGLYSTTTRKQIGYFLKEYFNGLTYQDIKGIYENNKTISAKISVYLSDLQE